MCKLCHILSVKEILTLFLLEKNFYSNYLTNARPNEDSTENQNTKKILKMQIKFKSMEMSS